MSKYRKIDLRIWSDERFRALSKPQPNARDCFIYLLTAPSSTILPGTLTGGCATSAEVLRWTPAKFREVFAEIEDAGMAFADWDAGLAWVPKAIRYNPPNNCNVAKAWGKALRDLPECALRRRVLAEVESFLKGFAKGFLEDFRDGYANTGAVAGAVAGKETGVPGPLSLDLGQPAATTVAAQVRIVFEHWVQVFGFGTRAKLNDVRRRGVERRLKEGYTVDDLKSAVSGCLLTPWNMGENDAKKKYVDLELICRSGSQVERFRETAETAAASPPKMRLLGTSLADVKRAELAAAASATTPGAP